MRWLARGKLKGQNLKLYILEQLPVIPPAACRPADSAVVCRTRRQLCHSSHDLDGLARDLAQPGPPVGCCPARPERARARIDTLDERLYGLHGAHCPLVA